MIFIVILLTKSHGDTMKIIEALNELIWFGSINEANLSRLISQVQNKDFCIMSAFRTEDYTLEQNRERNRSLLKFLNGKKMGGYPLIGHWQTAPQGVDYKDATKDQLVDSIEESFLFPKPENMSREDFIAICSELRDKYDQEAVIIGFHKTKDDDRSGFYLYFAHGSNDKIGDKLSLGKIAQAYSVMKKKPNVPFVFEGVIEPKTNFGKMAFTMYNMEYLR